MGAHCRGGKYFTNVTRRSSRCQRRYPALPLLALRGLSSHSLPTQTLGSTETSCILSWKDYSYKQPHATVCDTQCLVRCHTEHMVLTLMLHVFSTPCVVHNLKRWFVSVHNFLLNGTGCMHPLLLPATTSITCLHKIVLENLQPPRRNTAACSDYFGPFTPVNTIRTSARKLRGTGFNCFRLPQCSAQHVRRSILCSGTTLPKHVMRNTTCEGIYALDSAELVGAFSVVCTSLLSSSFEAACRSNLRTLCMRRHR